MLFFTIMMAGYGLKNKNINSESRMLNEKKIEIQKTIPRFRICGDDWKNWLRISPYA